MGFAKPVAVPTDAVGVWFSCFPQVWLAICGNDADFCLFDDRFFYPIHSDNQGFLMPDKRRLSYRLLSINVRGFRLVKMSLLIQLH